MDVVGNFEDGNEEFVVSDDVAVVEFDSAFGTVFEVWRRTQCAERYNRGYGRVDASRGR